MKTLNQAALIATLLTASGGLTAPRFDALDISPSARAPKADMSNAQHLMGDIYGSPFTGDPRDAQLSSWMTLVGDANEDDFDEGYSEAGAPKKFRDRTLAGKIARIAIPTAAVGAGVYFGAKALAKRKQKRLAETVALNSAQSTISNQLYARSKMEKVTRDTKFPFYAVAGATLSNFPIDPRETFPALSLKYVLDKQGAETPFSADIVTGVYGAGTFVCTASGVATNRYYSSVILTAGIPYLSAAPGTMMTVTGTFPTLGGTLSVTGTSPWTFLLQSSNYDCRLVITPWQLVTNRPELAVGVYSNAAPIIVNVTGLPAAANVTLTVPGTTHPYTNGLRERMSNL